MNLIEEIDTRIKTLEKLRDALLEVDPRDLKVRKLELIPQHARMALSAAAQRAQQGGRVTSKAKAKKDRLSEEGRAKIIAAQKKRHAAARQAEQQERQANRVDQPATERRQGAA